MRRIALLIVAVLAAAAPAAASGAVPPIAYTKGGDVHLIRPDGHGDRVLFRKAEQPAWAPDGRKLAVVRGKRVLVVSPSGRRTFQGFGGERAGGAASPSWSADSRTLAWTDQYGVWRWRVSSAPITRLARQGTKTYDSIAVLAFGPGSLLATVPTTDMGLYIDLDIRTRHLRGAAHPRTILSGGYGALPWAVTGFSLSWSPDGRTLLTTAQAYAPAESLPNPTGPPRSATVRVADGHKALLPAPISYAAWAPDGRHVCGIDANQNLVVATTGSAATRVIVKHVDNPSGAPACSWRGR
jgi:hypothetical protein